MKVYKKLNAVQTELKAPKNQKNTFGGYNYRSCEDILEALKPLLKKHGAAVTITDDITMMGDRFYIRATASFIDIDTGDKAEAIAYAREDERKKGMDLSQLTGSTSSYARKYALNGLFAIDDTKDSDYTNTHGKATNTTKKQSKGNRGQAEASEGHKCSQCNASINQAVYTYSTKNMGKALCFNCQQKHK